MSTVAPARAAPEDTGAPGDPAIVVAPPFAAGLDATRRGSTWTALQRQAPAIIRRHALRSLGRVGLLLGADLGTYLGLRTLSRVVRNVAVPDSRLHHFLSAELPLGFLSGWHFAGALLIALVATGNYCLEDNRPSPGKILAGSMLATALVLWTPFWTLDPRVVALQYAITVPVIWAAFYAQRLLLHHRIEPLWLTRRPSTRRILLVGQPGEIERLLEHSARLGATSPRMLDTVVAVGPETRGRCPLDGIAETIHRSGADTILTCGHLTDEQFQKLADASVAAGCELIAFSRSMSLAGVSPHVIWHDGHPLIRFTAPALKWRQHFMKRALDLVASGVGLVLLAPVFALIAVLIRLDSPGPALFSHERVGLGGRPFRMLKFRTMRNGADAEKRNVAHLNSSGDVRLFKIPNDPRVTRLGRVLRRWSLDELPQLWNVFRGEMSLVGPRPFFKEDLSAYEEHHFRRLGAKPGLTGIWQVQGRSEVTDFEEVVRMDREYVERWSMLMDLKILLLTVPAVLRRSGAY